jgi:putative NIF3 family GTP cyclohydrolase 1 type 2
MLDQMPGFGIQDTWADWLGFSGRPFEQLDAFRRIYNLEPQTLADLARHVASRTSLLGQTGLEVLGDQARTVTKIGIGTGAIVGGTPALSVYRDHGCEVVLITELTRWRELAWAEDVGLSLILVDHCVAEVPGLRALAEHLRETFPEVRVEYLPTECPTRLVGAP